MIYAREELMDVWKEAESLLKEHYNELTLNKEVMKLSPDWVSYFLIEAKKGLIIITAREDGKLVGYAAFFIGQHMHYKDSKTAQNDVLYMHKDYRRGFMGVRLIKESEKHLKHEGVVKVFWHIKDSNNFYPIMDRLGYSKEETIVSKILEE